MTDITALIITVKEPHCGACMTFKKNFYKTMVETFTRLDISIEEFEAPSLAGLKKGTRYNFLSAITFFPCIILIKNNILSNSNKLKLSEIFTTSNISIFNGTFNVVNLDQNTEMLKLTPDGVPTYQYDEKGYAKFVNDFISKTTNTSQSDSNIRDDNIITPFSTKPLVEGKKGRIVNPKHNVICGKMIPINTSRR